MPLRQTSKSQLKLQAGQDFMRALKGQISAIRSPTDLRATLGTYFKMTVVIAWFLLSYAALLTTSSNWVSIQLCVSLGLSIAAIGFNVFHDSIHGAICRSRWGNRVWAFLSCSLIGASHFIWRHKHNYLHHQFPNIQNWDDDLETRGALRLAPSQPWKPIYRFQHWYAPLVYSFTTIEWVFVRDFIRYFSGRMNSAQSLPSMTIGDHLEFWLSKTLYLVLTVVIPLQFVSPFRYGVGFLIVHFTTSIVLAVIFQLAHVMSESEFPTPQPDTGKLELNWAQLQFATTVNFAPRNRLLGWYCGGLNFQIEHHLFPGVSHAHYRELSPVVQATAKEFGYPYHSIPSQWGALTDHFRMLKRFSKHATGVNGAE